ncbi:hypothetical protein DPMN_134317 [Dreissena polymorpha]|uniref:Uncharacterized protein n=1 Tax=Dreissena polymorpha TaxID=45954 RepID=A0A9D4FX02_DREPO|nr:hypothetical protein DPMN_134317 [Dreissena polymorpha]
MSGLHPQGGALVFNVEDLDEVRSCRNEVFHSSTLNLENDELNRVFTTMTTFLKLPVFADFQTEVIHQLEYIRKGDTQEQPMLKQPRDAAMQIKAEKENIR